MINVILINIFLKIIFDNNIKIAKKNVNLLFNYEIFSETSSMPSSRRSLHAAPVNPDAAPAAPVNPVAAPAAPVNPAAPVALFRIEVDFRRGGPFMHLARLHRRAHALVVNLRNIGVYTTLVMWTERDIPAGTGHGLFFLRVQHHENLRVTSMDVTGWLMDTFPAMRPEQVQVTQIPVVEIRAEYSALVQNVFYPVLIHVTEPLIQT